MIDGHRVVVFIPSGRRRTEAILLTNLRRFPEVDEIQIWVNTDKPGKAEPQAPNAEGDEEWLRSLPDVWSKCKLYEYPRHARPKWPKQLQTGEFYAYTQDLNTVYIRMDDDIVYVDDNYFKHMVKFRLRYDEPPIVCGNIWNNAICSYIHQQAGHIDKAHGVVESPYCMDMVGWQSGKFAEYIHRVLLDHIEADTVPELYFDQYVLNGNKRFSISNFSFTGVGMRRMRPQIDDEEIWLTEKVPVRAGRANVICGDALVAHYSFFAQRPVLDQTDILDRYRQIAEDKLSAKYYELLGSA